MGAGSLYAAFTGDGGVVTGTVGVVMTDSRGAYETGDRAEAVSTGSGGT